MFVFTPNHALQGDQLYMAMCFWYHLKMSCVRVYSTMDKPLITRYQKNTATFIWSGSRSLRSSVVDIDLPALGDGGDLVLEARTPRHLH